MTITADRFARDTKNHRLDIAQDQGLYRHLKFRARTDDGRPTGIGWFDLITTPGMLLFTGDYDSVVFRRLPDMFEFFRTSADGNAPNLSYWAEKVASGGERAVMEWSEEAFRQILHETVAADIRSGNAPRGIGRAVRDQITDAWEYSLHVEADARHALDNFKHAGYEFHDTYEWSCRDYTPAFQWACHAILFGIREYDRAKAAFAAQQDTPAALESSAYDRQRLVDEYRGNWSVNPATADRIPDDRCPLCGTAHPDRDAWAAHMADHGREAFSWLARYQETHPAALA